MLLVFFAYNLRDWKHLMWFLAIYMLPFFVFYWIVPESPRWLLNKNKVLEARNVIKNISKFNNFYYRHMISRFFGKRK
jgi:OCT family organic cation transporter-like MFS transporter 4/5